MWVERFHTVWYVLSNHKHHATLRGVTAERPKSRFGRQDWLGLGLRLLAEQGPEALTVERLTAAAGKTRGSFYHHFTDQAAFMAGLGERWLSEATDALIEEAESAAPAGRRRETLARRAAGIDHALERALRRLAVSEPSIAEAVGRSDARRIDYLVGVFRAELGLPQKEAETRAQLQHCAFVGAQMVFPDAAARFRLRLEAALGATLWKA